MIILIEYTSIAYLNYFKTELMREYVMICNQPYNVTAIDAL